MPLCPFVTAYLRHHPEQLDVVEEPYRTRLGGGCTSGHGVCGISRLSVRSVVATVTFVAAGVVTVFVAGRLAPWVLAR